METGVSFVLRCDDERDSGETDLVKPARDEIIAWVGREVVPHEADVRRWLRRRLDDPAAVDDVIQDAYCRLADLGSVSHIDSGRAYFMVTVRNIVADQARRSRIVRIEAMEMDRLAIVDEAPGADRILEGRRRLRRVQALIAALPVKCREVFILRRIEHIPQREIALRLGISENTVESYAVRALKMIQAGLARAEDETRLDETSGGAGRAGRIKSGQVRG
jgi:RNA polymerase sigma-70 factor (ECF subfamily)